MKKISKKHYTEYREMTASEWRVVSRMAEMMAEEVDGLEEATNSNFELLCNYDRAMRAAFHTCHKGFGYLTRYSWASPMAREAMKNAFDNIGKTIEDIELDRYTYHKLSE